MSDKVAVITNAFRETKIIKNCIEQFKPFNLFHMVLSNNVSWNAKITQDDTPDVAKRLGAFVVEGLFINEAQQFNYGLSLLQDYKMVIICDADERYEQDDIRKFIEMLETCTSEAVKTSTMSVYWKTPNFRIIPDQNDNPVIAVKPTTRFIKARNCDAKIISWMPIELHHFSYVRSDLDMLKKISTFSHTDEFDIMDWYRNKWLNWTKDSENLHPVVPSQFKKAVWNPPPNGVEL